MISNGSTNVSIKGSLPALALLTTLIAPLGASADSISFVSDSSWSTLGLGAAQAVCLNASSPSPCPDGATQYGYGGSGWTADLTAIPGAQWIWAPGVTGDTAPVELATFTFRKAFVLTGSIDTATLRIASDDFASVRINGTFVGSIGSTTDAGIAGGAAISLASFNIAPFLAPGNNVIDIVGQNGEGSFAGCTDCKYSQHPAGVVFGGSITTVPVPPAAWLFGSGLLGIVGIARRRAA